MAHVPSQLSRYQEDAENQVSSFVRPNVASPTGSAAAISRLVGIAAFFLVAFLLSPGDVAVKTHAMLHGLCAQRPSHSLSIGGTILPLDARMTGIYLGAVTSGVWFLAAGRLRATARLPRSIIALLFAFIAAMAVDGLNALLVDLGAPHAYQPSNVPRLITGILAGTALGIAIVHLQAISLWSIGERRQAVVSRPAEVIAPLMVSGALGGVALSGLPILYAPFALGLVVATVAAFWTLGVVLLALISNRAWRYQTPREVAPLASIALVVTILTIAGLAGARYIAEQHFGLLKLT